MSENNTERVEDYVIFSGNSNPMLVKEICGYLNIKPGRAKVKKFSDNEIQIQILENIRLKEVFIVQSSCNSFGNSVNDNLMEVLIMIDALKRSSARRITVVMPYYGYARQDRKPEPRVPISAKLVAILLEAAGANRIITMDLHADQIQGFFETPVDHLHASYMFIDYIKSRFADFFPHVKIVGPDAGSAETARAYAKRLGVGWCLVDKEREEAGKIKEMTLIGDARGCVAIIVDDMIDTAGTITKAAKMLIDPEQGGATAVYVCSPHAVLSGPAVDRIIDSVIEGVVVSNSIPLNDKAEASGKFEVVSIAELIGEAIIRSHKGDTVSGLFI